MQRSLVQQYAGLYTQTLREFEDHPKRGLVLTPLDTPDMGALKVCAVCQIFLRYLRFHAQLAHHMTKCRSRPRLKTA